MSYGDGEKEHCQELAEEVFLLVAQAGPPMPMIQQEYMKRILATTIEAERKVVRDEFSDQIEKLRHLEKCIRDDIDVNGVDGQTPNTLKALEELEKS